MKQMSLLQAKNSFDELVKAANMEPVVLMEGDKPVRVLLSLEDMHGLEDYLDGRGALRAHEGGYVGSAASAALTQKYLHVAD